MISAHELNPHSYTTTPEQAANLAILLERINKVRNEYGRVIIITSGLRSLEDQERINPSAPKSKHLLGQAADMADPTGALRDWVIAHMDLMEQIGLWFEDFGHTRGWVHAQIVPPASGKRIFIP